MKLALLFFDFSLWYYTRAFRDLLAVWLNFMWFIIHFFSIPLLLRTLLQPWRRMRDDDKHRSIEEFMQGIVMNVMSRVLGLFARLTIIMCGLFFLIVGILALGIVLALWICAPVILIAGMLYGVRLFLV